MLTTSNTSTTAEAHMGAHTTIGRSSVAACAALLLAAGLLLTITAPADAASRTWSDSASDVGSNRPNITSVRLSNNRNRMFVRAKFRDLSARTFGGGTRLWIDTAGAGNPEFVVVSGLTDQGTDWQIFRANGWRSTGYPLGCDIDWSLDAGNETVRWSTGRSCLGDYGRLRVSVEASKDGTVDYSPARHSWHPYVRRG